jgi:NitT/TauT family transport system substrate-binding protein
MHLFKQRKCFVFLPYLLLVSLTLASCGGSGTPSNTSSSSMTLNVVQTTNAPSFFPIYVARMENFFKDQGLTLTPPAPTLLGSGTVATKALEAGDAEMVGGLMTDAFTLARVDSSVRVLGQLTTAYYVDIAVSKKLEQQEHVSATSSLADKVNALKGKTIGVTAIGSGTWALIVYLFKQQGLDVKKDVHIVVVGTTAAAGLAALSKGTVDAISFFTPTAQQAATRGFGDVLISPLRGDIPEMQGQVHGVFYTKQQVIDAKPKAVQAFIRGIAQAETFIHKNPAQTAVLLAKFLNITPKAASALLTTLLPSLAQTPVISQQGYDKADQFHVKAGLIAIALPYKDVVAADFTNNALSSMGNS